MSKKKKNWLSSERRERGGFAALPHCLLESQVFIGLSGHAVKMLVDLLTQFKGFNNGDLCLAWSLMAKRGWKSRDTLNKARQELLDVELIVITRYGDRKRPHLYALTFFAVDECSGKLDINATEKPMSLWRLHDPTPSLLQINLRLPPSVLNQSDITRTASDSKVPEDKYYTPDVSNEPISEML